MHKSKNLFFFLLQSELGDIYKVTLDLNGDEGTDVKVKTLHLSQFDKIK
jgi:splicing factor 3B subunit 3